MKVFDTYPGGKGSDGVYQIIINLIPPHNVKISGFLGNCAITRNIRPAPVNIGIDTDMTVVDRWKAVGSIDIDLFHMPFLDYWREYGHHFNFPDTFVFLDPPYPMSTRKKDDPIYKTEMTDSDHEKLLTCALSMKAKVMICTYENELYNHYLSTWKKRHFQGKTRRGPVTETLYMNYELEGKLHDYRFLGFDCYDRQRIRRKIDRHVSKSERDNTGDHRTVQGTTSAGLMIWAMENCLWHTPPCSLFFF